MLRRLFDCRIDPAGKTIAAAPICSGESTF